jgi:hypothetical protein
MQASPAAGLHRPPVMAHCWSQGPSQVTLPSGCSTQSVQKLVWPEGVAMRVTPATTSGPANRPAARQWAGGGYRVRWGKVAVG